MITKNQLPDFVGAAIERFKADNRLGDVAYNDDLKRIIEETTGAPLYDGAVADIREEMIRRQRDGLGVEAATISGSAWRFK